MSRFKPVLSGREARRAARFGPGARKKGAGWTRAMSKGRDSRLRPQDEKHEEEEQ